MKINKFKKGVATLLLASTFAITPFAQEVVTEIFTPGIEAHANTTEANTESRKALNQALKDEVNSKKYAVEGGGTLTGAQLVQNGAILDSNYNRLTPKARQELITDMVQVAENEVAKTEKKQEDGNNISGDAITAQTQQTWIQEIQNHPGVGTRMLTDILQTVKPDFAAARYIFEPFAGPLNTLIALGVIMLMTFLTLTFVFDLSYINIALFQAAASKEGQEGFSLGSLISKEARTAVEDADGGKVPTWTYFKKRSIGLIVLGLCLLFFVQGEIYTIVGWLLDMLSGVLNLG